ncbi:MAG TPA: DUF4142 domain-containing protein [Burkholderiaceae bacterium]|nr:DUF4142 domain-containing protein [Burkholderiaceae bacterium]
MTTKHTRLTARAVAACVTLCIAAASALAQLSRPEESFLKSAAHHGHAEVQASEVALKKSRHPQVQRYAREVLEAHRASHAELKALAARKGGELPDGPSPLQRARIRMLGTLDPSRFDTRYLDEWGVAAHEEAIALYQRAAREARDPEVKVLAERQLPVLREHLAAAQALKGRLAPSGEVPADAASPPASR